MGTNRQDSGTRSYKRPLWAWLVVIGFGALVGFAAASYSASRPPHLAWYGSGVGNKEVMHQLMDECRSTPVWADLPSYCDLVGYEEYSLLDILVTAVVFGLGGILVGHLVARLPERRIEELEEIVEEFDTGQIGPSRSGE
jgi:hypothetical protein